MADTAVAEPPAAEARAAWKGQSVPRKEDGRLVRGQGKFVDDLWMHRMGHVHFLRSPHAHATIASIDVSKAAAMDGVFATLTGEEVEQLTEPYFQMAPGDANKMRDFCLAVGRVRFMGEPVAAVLAETPGLARDAAELIEVTYEPLPVIVDGVATAKPTAPVLHDEIGHNVAWQGVYDYGDIDWAIANADHVVRIPELYFHRFSSTPIECNAALVDWDAGTNSIDIKSNIQMPIFASMYIGPALGIGTDRINWQTQDIGGGFGIKITTYTYITALALLSRKAGRPAKWVETRSEHLTASGHGNERTFLDVEVPVMKDGTILGFRMRCFDDAGAFLRYEPLGAVIWAQVLVGCYRFKHVHVDYAETLTNKVPVCPNRGYSRLQHLWAIERMVDLVAQELDFDPVELRKKNFVQPEDYPYEVPNGCIYDSGDLPQSLDKALALIDYPAWRTRQQEAVGTGKRIGIGIGSTLDSGTNNFGQSQIINPELPFTGNGEAAIVKLGLYGEVSASLGTVPQGQGHETTAAQVVADILGLAPDGVYVTAGFNSQHNTHVGFSGTYASQFAITGLSAVAGAAEMLKQEIVRIGAFALGADESEIEVVDGFARVRGDEERAIPFIGIANMVLANIAVLPDELADSVSLSCRYVYRPPFKPVDAEKKFGNISLTWANQIHACVLEIDEATGQATILDYAAVDDCGVRINPAIVEGQVHGAAAHGIGGALHEVFHYDEDGQLLNATFFDYHAATALDVPLLKTDSVESPSLTSPNGAKGMGEGGGAPLHAVSNAIQDALGKDGGVVTQAFNPPETIFDLLHASGVRGVEVTSR